MVGGLMVTRLRVGSHVVAIGRCRHGRRRPGVTRLSVLRRIRMVMGMLRCYHEWRLLHRGSCEGGSRVGLSHARLGVHALDGDDASQRGIRSWLGKVGLTGLRSGVVRDEVEVLAGRSGDAERLLHQTVGLVSVSLGLAVVLVLVATASRVGRLASVPSAREATSSLALHFPVGQEAARHSAGAPRLAVGPSSHAGLSLIPHKHRAGSNRLPLLLGESSLHSRQDAQSACLEQPDGVGGRSHVAVVGFHLVQEDRV